MSQYLKTLGKQIVAPLPATWRNYLRLRYRRSRDVLQVWRFSLHDANWYTRHSGLGGGTEKGVLQARIIKSYHRIEKGLALPLPRPGFGADAIAQLIEDLSIYQRRYGNDHILQRALQTLDEYRNFSALAGTDVSAVSRALQTHNYTPQASGNSEGGTMEVTREAIHSAAKHDLTAFFRNRYSVRQFSPEPVSEALIEEAVRMAQKSPSVCNRESGRLFLVSSPEKARALLGYQNGNRGFGEHADKLLVITARLDCFLTPGERYQCWIDGGLFAMSLIYALHALGLGSCCLNWSVEPETDAAFKRAAGIPADQAVVMLLAVGHLPERFRVAISARRPIDEVLVRI